MRLLAGLATVVVLFVMTACSSDATDQPDKSQDSKTATQTTQTETTTTEAPAPEVATVESLAAKLGCTSVEPAKKMFATTAGQCTLPNGSKVELAVFPANEARDQYVAMGKQVMPDVVIVTGGLWSAGGPNCTEADLAPLK